MFPDCKTRRACVVSAPGSWCPAEVSTERLKAIVLRYARAKWDKSLAKVRPYYTLCHYESVVCWIFLAWGCGL